ncbi:MAG: HlyD family efflux transporter periplasmic adaptor subunit, partial [Planctomycetes bacterium]|nr:HlyD family efflux transporter periplasmic adaptor subunit [Planctomycetota bacterium]
ERVDSLQQTRAEVGGQAAELAATKVQLAQTRAATTEAAEQHSETMALRAELGARRVADRERYRLLLATAQSQLGLSVEELLAEGSGGQARWRSIDRIEVRAQQAGVVTTIADSNGAWLQAGDHVLELVDPHRLRFVGTALQGDLGRLAAGQQVRVVAPTNGTGSDSGLPSGAGRLVLGALADPTQRTIGVAVQLDEVPPWARHGIAAFAEVETAASGPGVLAVPLAAIVEHGLGKVLFLRNPRDADEVIRVDADLGVDDGRWVEVKSGITDGDEVVVAGAYALVLASAPQQQGGHFHADGTWHADDDHK